ncbi:hypothetical protein C8Q80DRAFT_1216523 [Daedaleopsis nitida]|nr:hypothetical protein C8Q80DRAFT_1216523 [Daedaleopsis nitida]
MRPEGRKLVTEKKTLKRFLDPADKKSTGNLRKHARVCWGAEILETADKAADADEVRRSILPGHLQDGSITAHFACKKGSAVTYSHRQHTKAETRLKLVEWCAEDLRPFSAVKDRALLSLLKTGRPGYYVPSPSTCVRSRIAKMLREYDGKLSFGTDAWTSPNHRALVAVTVHLEHKGQPLSMLLDVVEVSKVRTLLVYITSRGLQPDPLLLAYPEPCCEGCA